MLSRDWVSMHRSPSGSTAHFGTSSLVKGRGKQSVQPWFRQALLELLTMMSLKMWEQPEGRHAVSLAPWNWTGRWSPPAICSGHMLCQWSPVCSFSLALLIFLNPPKGEGNVLLTGRCLLGVEVGRGAVPTGIAHKVKGAASVYFQKRLAPSPPW